MLPVISAEYSLKVSSPQKEGGFGPPLSPLTLLHAPVVGHTVLTIQQLALTPALRPVVVTSKG